MTKSTNNQYYEEDKITSAVNLPYQKYTTTIQLNIHHFYISTDIGFPDQYVDLIHTIATAIEGDEIHIHLNTEGGDLYTGIQIINAMQNSKALVITYVEGTVCSLGTLIFLAGHELHIMDNSLFMIHNFSGGIFGEGHKMISKLEATVNWFNTIARNLYIPFLSEDEFSRVIHGEDLWFDSVQVRERVQRIIDSKIGEENAEDDDR